MNIFLRAREEFYGQLYGRFLENSGPYLGKTEVDALKEINPLIARAALYASDLKHIHVNRLGSVRLTASGVDYYEKEFLGE